MIKEAISGEHSIHELERISAEMSSVVMDLYQSDMENIRLALETATGEEAEELRNKLRELEEKMQMEVENQQGYGYTDHL